MQKKHGGDSNQVMSLISWRTFNFADEVALRSHLKRIFVFITFEQEEAFDLYKASSALEPSLTAK